MPGSTALGMELTIRSGITMAERMTLVRMAAGVRPANRKAAR